MGCIYYYGNIRSQSRMGEIVSEEVMLILNSVLLGLFAVTVLLSLYRLAVAYRKVKLFLPVFFGLVTLISCIELGLQIYQIVSLTSNDFLFGPTLVIINLYAMIFEAAAMFVLADYWGQTSEILTKQSTQEQIRLKKHRLRPILLILWTLVFSAFVGYSAGTNSLSSNGVVRQVLVLGCQGLGVVWVLWANIMQIVMGYRMSVTLRRYEDWVSLSIRKVQFCFLLWISSGLNLVRSLFLIATTLVIELGYEDSSYWWLFGYVYAFTNVPILVIYLLGFSTKQQVNQIKSTLIDQRRSSQSRRSRGDTQLSRTHSSRSEN